MSDKYNFHISNGVTRQVVFRVEKNRDHLEIFLNGVFFGVIRECGRIELNPNIMTKIGSIDAEYDFQLNEDFAKQLAF